jgi:POT family proton-dependent oligopeptide transporter
MNTTGQNTLSQAPEQAVFGHPKGLYYLAFTELWERFSYYGMTALVVLYMINQLLLPGHAEHIVGFAELRAGVEWLFGPLSTKALASQIFGLYAGLVYFPPLMGGLIADRWIGQRNAVVIGALLMSAGHLAMTFDESFLVALALLVTGSGFLKGNITSQVGAVYPPGDEERSARGFVIYSTGINIGAVLGPLACGWLGNEYGWHYGFGAAAVLMLVALGVYLAGYRHLPAKIERDKAQHEQLTGADWRVIGALVAVIVITIFPSLAYFQHFNALPVWIQDHVDLNVGGFHIPVPWFQSIDSFTSIVAAAPLLWLWRRQAARGDAPGNLAKIATGAWITAVSSLMLVAGITISGGNPVHPFWPLLYCIGLGIAFIHYWPALLALVSRCAPARLVGTMMGLVFVSLFFTSLSMGWLGAQYERMDPNVFWGIHVAIGATGGLLVLLFGRGLERMLRSA